MGLEDIFYNDAIGQYTILGTMTYAALLVTMVYLIYNRVIKGKVKVDKKFVLSVIPFMIFGGLLRAASDVILQNPVPAYIKFFIVTPGIYFTVTGLAALSLYASMKATKNYFKTMLLVGSALSAAGLIYLVPYISNWAGMGIVLAILAGWGLALTPISLMFSEYLSRENLLIILSHMLDASATFTALQLHSNLGEKHVLPNLLIFDAGLGPWVMFALKLAVVWPVLYYIDKNTKDESYRNFLKIFVIILGLSLGIRDIFAVGIFGVPLFQIFDFPNL